MRLVWIALLPLAGCLGAPGTNVCTGDETVPAASGSGALCLDARREFIVVYPDEVEGAAIILALHGGGGDAENMMRKTALHEAASDAVVVYPEGTPATRDLLRTWNAMHCCGKAFAEGTDDVAFLAALVEAMQEKTGGTRVVVTGHSNGGMMAHRFAAERPDLVDVLVPVAGAVGGQVDRDSETVRPPQPDAVGMEVVIVHAIDDTHVPYLGGSGPDSIVPARVDLSVAESHRFWSEAGATVDIVATMGGHRWPEAPDASALVASLA